jgi:predicted outer membrane repeat protein
MLKTEINKCRFTGNISAKGGAIYTLDVDSVLVDSCDFQYNEATNLTSSSTDNLGAALRMNRYLKYFAPFYCAFTNNVMQHSRSDRGG